VFGIGPQEVVVIVLLILVVFGPGKAVSMARDLGRFVSEVRGQVEEFKGELLDDEEDGDELTGDPQSDVEDEVPQRQVSEELSGGEEVPPAEVNGHLEQRRP
jgi:Sec-independent protein translocase protein TatA